MGTEVDCRNHIREVHPILGGSALYICGTNSLAPTNWQVQADDLTLLPVEKQVRIEQDNNTGKAIGCPYNIRQNTSALWVEDEPERGTSFVVALRALDEYGNTYVLARTEIFDSRKGSRVHRDLSTQLGDINILNEPSSAGAFTLREHVYFVFREQAVERMACGTRTVSTLARLCKNDLGHGISERRWTSFMKLRLRCLDTANPRKSDSQLFSYDEIRDAYLVPDLEGGLLLGVFVTVTHRYPQSAVCAFRMADIGRVFSSSDFFEPYRGDTYAVCKRAKNVPTQRPGTSCPLNSRTLGFEGPRFLADHPLLADQAPQRHNRTFFERRGVVFSSLVAFELQEDWGTWLVCYVATGAREPSDCS
ncbi:semaphorin-2A-like isoform X2 [Dermacentor silvarum]|uniref:semaphorin-2A-like isoform X2 n=1 Tax=Dermacentor silvarum TaxID=543639 RepID=UPI0018971D86|nr:semaphorin-2A-like isoform X2 [Dermacentor silvarum]